MRLLGQLLRALDNMSVPYKVFVPRPTKYSSIVEENVAKRLSSMIGIGAYRRQIGGLSSLSISMRILLRALRELGEEDVLLVRGTNFIETLLTYLFRVFKRFRLIVYTGVYGSHVFDLGAVNAYGQTFPNYGKKIRILRGDFLYAPIYMINTILSRLLRHIVVFSAFSKPLLAVFKRGRRVITVLYPAVDTDFFTFKRLVSYSDPVLSVVARISREKNIHLAIMLADKLSSLFGDLKLIICGNVEDQSYYRYLMEIASRSKAQVVMNTSCSWEEARRVYWSSNILLNFSEGAFGIVNAEALVCGCVPVAHSEFSNAVLPYGLVFRSPREALRKVARLLRNTNELRWRSLRGSEYANKTFSFKAFMEHLKEILESAT